MEQGRSAIACSSGYTDARRGASEIAAAHLTWWRLHLAQLTSSSRTHPAKPLGAHIRSFMKVFRCTDAPFVWEWRRAVFSILPSQRVAHAAISCRGSLRLDARCGAISTISIENRPSL